MPRALPRALRTGLESAFGASLRDVRIHQAALVSAPGVVACTRGPDIYFAPGRYDPGSEAGRDILGHELAHVLQQRFGRAHGGASRWRLEAEACLVGRQVARGEPVTVPGHAGTRAFAGRPVTQHYTVIAPAAFGAHAVAIGLPQATAPTAATDTWIGQTKGGAGGPSSFLGVAGPNLVSGAPAGTSLRLSANGNMAIEDADLTNRQPKVFYATQAVIDASNARLGLLGSRFRLVPDPVGPNRQQITVNAQVLLRVTPQNVINATAGLVMQAAQSCDSLVEQVAGAAYLVPQFEQPLNPPPHLLIEYHVARALLPPPVPPVLDASTDVNLGTTMRQIAAPYGAAARVAAPPFPADVQQYGLNEHTNPEVGEGFVTSTLVAAVVNAPVSQVNMPPTHADHYHLAGLNPQIVQNARTWGSHWGGVVAKDGADLITLENYARNVEDALAGADTRYYFQMYSTNPAAAGSTWHTSWTSTPMQLIAPAPAAIGIHAAATHEPVSPGARSFANPITMRVVVPNARYGALAAGLYGAVNINTIKDHHNLVAGAADADQELREVLKGLQYANAHIAANQAGRTSRRNAWDAALLSASAAARFRGNRAAILYALSRIQTMQVH